MCDGQFDDAEDEITSSSKLNIKNESVSLPFFNSIFVFKLLHS